MRPKTHPDSLTAFSSSKASFTVMVIGFSHITWKPAFEEIARDRKVPVVWGGNGDKINTRFGTERQFVGNHGFVIGISAFGVQA